MHSVQAITTAPSYEPMSNAERASPAPAAAPSIHLPAASVGDTVVLLLAIGAIVVACGVVTVLTLHPISARTMAEWGMAILAGR